jgi:hypothetical protein
MSIKSSAQGAHWAGRRDILSIVVANIEHVLVEPFNLIAHREAKILQLLRDIVVAMLALLEDPSG